MSKSFHHLWQSHCSFLKIVLFVDLKKPRKEDILKSMSTKIKEFFNKGTNVRWIYQCGVNNNRRNHIPLIQYTNMYAWIKKTVMKQNIKANHSNALISNKSGRLDISINEKKDLLHKISMQISIQKSQATELKTNTKSWQTYVLKKPVKTQNHQKNNTQYVKIIRKP
jgi:hypothetical protein